MLTTDTFKDLLDRANLSDPSIRADADRALGAWLGTARRGEMTEAEFREGLKAALRPYSERQRRLDAERHAWTCDGRWVPRGNRRCDNCGGFHGMFGRTEKPRNRTWIG